MGSDSTWVPKKKTSVSISCLDGLVSCGKAQHEKHTTLQKRTHFHKWTKISARQIWNYCPLNDNNFQNDYCRTVINILAAPLPVSLLRISFAIWTVAASLVLFSSVNVRGRAEKKKKTFLCCHNYVFGQWFRFSLGDNGTRVWSSCR